MGVDQEGFHVDLRIREGSGATSTSFYFGSGGYVYGGLGNTSQMDITRTGGGTFSYDSIKHWAFQGSQNATLVIEGYAAGTLVGQESYTLATPTPGWWVDTSTYQAATVAGLAGKSVDRLVLLPNFTENPTNQTAVANLTLTPGAASAPEIASPTSAEITATSATLGGNVTGDGGEAITGRGVVYSLTSVNSDPLIGGTGVAQVTSDGTTGVFTVTATGLATGIGYSFKAYAINSGGTTYSDPVSSFTTLTALENWRLTYFETTENAGNAADGFDYDNDGVVNLIEFAFGLDPTDGGSVALPQAQWIGNDLVVTFTQPEGVSGVTYGAEWSTTLEEDWTPITDSGTGSTHTFSIPRNSNTKLFIRLKVMNP